MITLIERQIEIITLLLLKDDWCIAEDLEDAFSVSNRTIRNDIAQIKIFLNEIYLFLFFFIYYCLYTY